MEPEKYDRGGRMPKEIGSITCRFTAEPVLTEQQVAEIRARIARED